MYAIESDRSNREEDEAIYAQHLFLHCRESLLKGHILYGGRFIVVHGSKAGSALLTRHIPPHFI